MAIDVNPFQEIGGQFASKIMGSMLWFGVAFIIIGIVGGTMWYFLLYKKKFDIIIKIISNRAQDRDTIIFDKAAILKEYKTGVSYFRIWGLKIDMPVPKFNIIQTSNKGDYIELYRDSQSNLYFLTPPKVDKKRIINTNGQLIPLANQEMIMIDTDVAFWSQKRKGCNNKMFDTDSMMAKLLPYLPQVFAGIIIIFILYILMDNLPTILAQMTKLAKVMTDMNQAQATIQG